MFPIQVSSSCSTLASADCCSRLHHNVWSPSNSLRDIEECHIPQAFIALWITKLGFLMHLQFIEGKLTFRTSITDMATSFESNDLRV